MRRLFTFVLALSLVVAGFVPLAVPVTANVCDHGSIVTSGRFHGTIAVVSTKRSPVAQSTVTVFATIMPARHQSLAWTHELVVLPSSLFSSRPDRSAISPRAPPAGLTSQLS